MRLPLPCRPTSIGVMVAAQTDPDHHRDAGAGSARWKAWTARKAADECGRSCCVCLGEWVGVSLCACVLAYVRAYLVFASRPTSQYLASTCTLLYSRARFG